MTSEHPEEWTDLETELREKVEQWRVRIERMDELTQEGRLPKANQLEECADEIEELIE